MILVSPLPQIGLDEDIAIVKQCQEELRYLLEYSDAKFKIIQPHVKDRYSYWNGIVSQRRAMSIGSLVFKICTPPQCCKFGAGLPSSHACSVS